MNEKITTFGHVYEEAERLGRNCYDEQVPTNAISFNSLDTIQIGQHPYQLKPVAARQICSRLGVPHSYLERSPADVQAFNLNHWIEHYRANENMFVRYDGNAVRAIFTPRYVPADHLDVLDQLNVYGLDCDTKVQVALDDGLMMLNVPNPKETFTIQGRDKVMPGISIANSEVGLSSLTISMFCLRLVCTNGMISRQRVNAKSFRHISDRALNELPDVLANIDQDTEYQQRQFRFSLASPVENPLSTLKSFNRQYQLSENQVKAVDWAWPQEKGETMINVVNTYTRAAQHQSLQAEDAFNLQKVGGEILSLVQPDKEFRHAA